MIVGGLALDAHAEEESTLLYFGGGPAFPDKETDLNTGWSLGGGLGFVLTSDTKYSLEFRLYVNWYAFSEDTYLSQRYPQYDLGHEYHTTINLELKFRKNVRRFFNPYGVFGGAFYSGFPPLSTLTLGAGSDLRTGPEGKRLLFWEVRYFSEPDPVIWLHVGIRLG